MVRYFKIIIVTYLGGLLSHKNMPPGYCCRYVYYQMLVCIKAIAKRQVAQSPLAKPGYQISKKENHWYTSPRHLFEK